MVTVRAALVSAFVAASSAACGQTVPKVGAGQSYVSARAHVFDAGWRANVYDTSRLPDRDRDLRAWYLERGFGEIESCTGKDRQLCTAVFHAGGYKLYYFLSGGEKGHVAPGGPTIVTYCLSTPSVRCDPPGS